MEEARDNDPDILFPGVELSDLSTVRRKQSDAALIKLNTLTTCDGYDPHKVPPCFEVAKKHSVTATQTAKKVTKLQEMLTRLDSDESQYCPCCSYPLEASKFSIWCSIYDLSELGDGFPLHYHMVRWVCLSFVVAFLVAGVYCLIENYNENRIDEWNSSLQGSVLMQTSLANFGRKGTPSQLQPWLHVLCLWCFLALHQYLSQRHAALIKQFDKDVITPSDYACMFIGLPKRLDIGEFSKFVERLMPSCKVSKVNLAYDVREYAGLKEGRRRLKDKLAKIQRIREMKDGSMASSRWFPNGSATESIESIRSHLAAIDKRLSALKVEQREECAGTAFVCFQQDESNVHIVAKEFAQAYGSDKPVTSKSLIWGRCFPSPNQESNISYEGNALTVYRAPEPDNIQWANLAVYSSQVTTSQRRKRRLLTYAATGLVLLAGAGVIFISSLSKRKINDKKGRISDLSNSENFLFSLIVFLPSVLTVLINMLIAVVIRRFSLLERDKTFTNYNSSVANKLTVALFLNTAIVAILVNWGRWYEEDGLTHEICNILIANAIIPPIVSIISPIFLVKKLRQWFESRKGQNSLLSQSEAQQLFESPRVDMSHKCAIFMKTYLLTLFYAPILPWAFGIGACAMSLQYWIDKVLLLRRFSRPDVLSHELDDSMLRFLSLGTVLYAGTNFMFFTEFSHEAIAPGIVGVVSAVSYNFLPVKRLLATLRQNAVVGVGSPLQKVVSESDMSYEEATTAFIDVSDRQDYDRCNPATAEEGKRQWLDSLRKKHLNLCSADTFFPGVAEQWTATIEFESRKAMLWKRAGVAGPQRRKRAPNSP